MPSEAAIVIVGDGCNRILFLRRSITCPKYPLHWGLPGGYLDPGETPRQAAVRELWEETGFHSRVADLTRVSPRNPANGIHIFRAQAIAGDPVSSDGEHDGFVWTEVDYPPYPLAPGVDEMLRFQET